MTLSYDVAGSGARTVVLVHGFPLTSRMWDQQVAALAGDGWRVVTVDLPGFGRSPGTITSLDDAADAVAGVIDELGAGPVVLGGFSMGGYVAFAFVRRHADRLRGLMLIDTRAAPDSDEGRQGRYTMARRARAEGAQPIVDAMLPRLLSDSTLNGRRDVVDRMLEIAAGATPEGIAAALEAMAARPSSESTLAQIAVPTLVITGQEDVLAPVGEVEGWAKQIKGARFVVIPDAGHTTPLEQPELVTAAMREFLATL